jgi:hypothetical protein
MASQLYCLRAVLPLFSTLKGKRLRYQMLCQPRIPPSIEYAVRLGRLKANNEYHDLLSPLDHQGLLTGAPVTDEADDLDMDALASDLEDLDGLAPDITEVRHVRSVSQAAAWKNALPARSSTPRF